MRRRPKTPNIEKIGIYSRIFLYSIFTLLLYVLAIPFLLSLLTKIKYKKSIPARFFLYKNPPLKNCDIWFHSCSLGETKAVMPLAKRFDSFGFSVITGTGFDEANAATPNTRFLPYEPFLPFWAPRAKVLVVMEAELWPLLFVSAKLHGAKTALINARISERSYPKYKRFAFFYKTLFYFVDVVYAQSEADKLRLESLGAKNVSVVGNIKQFVGGYEIKELADDGRRNFVAASTHEGEEKSIAEAFKTAGLLGKERLVVVPRHPERFESVALYLSEFAAQNSLSFSRFSEDASLFADIVLVDKIGELINIYAKAYLVLLGGAFAEIGGHNPLEPAYFGAKLISGTHIFNQKASFEKVKNAYFCVVSELPSLLENHETLVKSETFELEDSIGNIEKGIRELLKR
jgi:3-deoxy-D-manno-octulosonic-acid transferase